MPFAVYLSVSARGRCARAHVPDLPGCSVMGSSRDDALAMLPAAIADYLAWLKTHGERPPSSGGATAFEIVSESVGPVARHPGDQAALLPPDLLSLPDEEIARRLRLMRFARADLLALVGDLSDPILDWQPPTGWGVRAVLRHISGAERWYLDRIGLYTPLGRTHSVFEHMAATRELAYDVLSRLTLEQRSAVVVKGDEQWTAPKVFRRFLEHEREHTGQVQDILTRCQALTL